ncbi:hypothetical protein [Ferrovibrio sp.]|uniref:pPIWI_RE_Z domain-containing protein n=1 Tax=Ferrovibrio sp. TaxID=1917215 RepID=UPI003D107100
MKTDSVFIEEFKKRLLKVDPAARNLKVNAIRSLGITELCLHFVANALPDEQTAAVPFLMSGYPKLLNACDSDEVRGELNTLRHIASRYSSISAWIEATRAYSNLPETMRCYNIVDRKPIQRATAAASVLELLDTTLESSVPWKERRATVAVEGEAKVRLKHGEAYLSYDIPPVPKQQLDGLTKYNLARRAKNAAIRISLDDLDAAAKKVDEREAMSDWPGSLPPLKLRERLKRLQLQGLQDGFFEDGTISLEGAVHLVGMLSSGKSTLVWGILFALTLRRSDKRIAMLVSDTIQGATVSARLRKHGVTSTVLSSFYNREYHLNSIHWQQSETKTGWSLSEIGDITQGFSVACPLDGMQSEPKVIRGGAEFGRFPLLREKPCHRLQQAEVDDSDEDDGETYDTDMDLSFGKSCPLWASCPAQEQQRTAVTAQVVIMTPQAFVHMSPDKWVANERITIPELLQFTTDLVIIDEVDGMQKSMDDIFSPRAPIMGDERGVYAPAIGAKTSESLRERSGIQFRREMNAKWQSSFHTFFKLIGMIYAMLQNEDVDLKSFYHSRSFTAASILYDLWIRRKEIREKAGLDQPMDEEAAEDEFLEVIKVATSIVGRRNGSAASQEEIELNSEELKEKFNNPAFKSACERLQALGDQVLVADYYEDLVQDIQDLLKTDLEVFNASSEGGSPDEVLRPADRVSPRANALALLLAVVADHALSRYNWLIRSQPAVAADFSIEDEQLFTQANNLIRNYRTLLPTNPAGAVFGFFYDMPPQEKELDMGGKLTLVNHLGVGRHLVTHLHDLLAAEGQAGPHVLMLSGTSWSGGSNRRRDRKSGKLIDASSPSFDIQVPVKGILMQPKAELEAIGNSQFALVYIPHGDRGQVRVSGVPEKQRRENLAFAATQLAIPRGNSNALEDHWRRMEEKWGASDIVDRRRALLVTNSYADAAVVADTLAQVLEGHGYTDWVVRCLTPDKGDDRVKLGAPTPTRAKPLPRSLVESFGDMPERSILVAPMQVVARGHNILNRGLKAAISSIYFLHRPHPRPDDLGPVIGRLNRFAMERYEKGMKFGEGDADISIAVRARRMRYAARNEVYRSLANRGGYSMLPAEYKAQFAWDMLTPLWQTIGRGIRNGCPVFVGFVDRQFAPMSFNGQKDRPETSAIVQAIWQLEQAIDPNINPNESEVARLLYGPFHDALSATKDLNYV